MDEGGDRSSAGAFLGSAVLVLGSGGVAVMRSILNSWKSSRDLANREKTIAR
jgi:hypothetical protein